MDKEKKRLLEGINELGNTIKEIQSQYYTEAQARASKKYLENFDEIRIRVPKGKKDEYKALAESEGKSMNQFIIDKIEGKA